MNNKEKKIIKSVVNLYNSIKEKYNDEFFIYDINCRYIDLFLESISAKGSKVLDIGCASGRDVKYIKEKGFDVIGIDLSDNFLKLAKKQVPGGKFIKMNACELKFQQNTFDGILAAYVFMHIPRNLSEKTLKSYSEVLKPNGKILLLNIIGNKEEYLDEPFLPETKLYYSNYSNEDIKRLLKKCNFEVDYITEGSVNNPYEPGNNIQVVLATNKK